MSLQSLIVGLLVAWAGVYAAWVLMPAPFRRGLLRLGARHWPTLTRRVAPSTESGCGGCGGGCAPPAGRQGREATVQVVRLQRRKD